MLTLLLRIILFVFILNSVSTKVFAGVCDLSGSGIGGTGAPIPIMDDSGIGGTGYPTSKQDNSGIGGTGINANGSGIGGTGQKNGNKTGVIIGTITGFGSICVNGIEIHYTESTPITIDGENVNTERLNLGQVVSVNVIGTGNEVYAKDINVINIIAGPVTDIELNTKQVSVLGQKIGFSGKTIFSTDGTNRKGIQNLQKGNFIQVSGLRQANGNIIASRIEKFIDKNVVIFRGNASNITSRGFNIGKVAFETRDQTKAKEGQQVFVVGEIKADKVLVHNLTTPILKDNQRVNLEGFVSAGDKQGQIKIGSMVVEATDNIKNKLLSLNPNQSVIIDGTLKQNQSLEALNIIVNPSPENTEVHNKSLGIHKDNHKSHSKAHDKNERKENEKNDSNEKKNTTDLHRHIKHDFEDSGIKHPEHESSGLEAPEEDKTEIKIPETEDKPTETEHAEIKEPEIETPESEETEIEEFEVEVPEVEETEVEAPEVEAPEIEVPEVETPEIE